MIRFSCPRCEKRLGVQESQAGEVGSCPECRCRFRIPAARNGDSEAANSPRKRPRTGGDGDARSAVARKRRIVEDEDQLPDDDEGQRRPVRKRKKKRRKSDSGLIAGIDGYTVTLAACGTVGLILFVFSLIWPSVAFVSIGLGWLMSITGGIWFISIAFREDPMCGVLCIVLPFYSLYYLITRFGEVSRPFFLNLLGAIIMLAGTVVDEVSSRGKNTAPKFRSEYRLIAEAERFRV